MDIPDELNKLMADLKRVTTKGSETGPLDRRSTLADCLNLLPQYLRYPLRRLTGCPAHLLENGSFFMVS